MTDLLATPGPGAAVAAAAGPPWIAHDRCPLCGGEGRTIGPLLVQRFFFSDRRLPAPPAAVALERCTRCTLVYKNWVPSPGLLVSLTAETEAGLWTDSYDYADERRLIDASVPGGSGSADLLDVGAAGGGMVRHFATTGRRSAMDIVPFSRLDHVGEFIQGFLESGDLRWSGRPYDVVTVFDVLEHLYEPPRAIGNLEALVKPGGLVVIETGDADAVAEPKLPFWPYLNYVEHHVAWNRRSIERLAQMGGFTIERFEVKRHKLAPLAHDTLPLKLRRAALRHAPRLVRLVSGLLGRRVPLVADPQRRDHLRTVLRRPLADGRSE